jgi:DNA-binding FadR family transcriptional regulator
VEPVAALLAAQAATREDRLAIAHAISRMQKAELGEDDALDSDIAFHLAVLHASGNRFYRQMREMTETALRFSIRKTNSLRGVRLASVTAHKEVADAILAGQGEIAETRMRNLMQTALDLMLEACRCPDGQKDK